MSVRYPVAMAGLGDRGRSDRDGAEDRIVQAGVRMGELLRQVIAAVLVLGMFVGLAYLVLVDRLADDALILYAGVILGYLLHSVKGLL